MLFVVASQPDRLTTTTTLPALSTTLKLLAANWIAGGPTTDNCATLLVTEPWPSLTTTWYGPCFVICTLVSSNVALVPSSRLAGGLPNAHRYVIGSVSVAVTKIVALLPT